MPRHGGSPLHLRVVIDGMFGAFAEENATVTFEMAQQVNTLHRLSDDLYRLSGYPFPVLGLCQLTICF
jgi:hypothetical protein